MENNRLREHRNRAGLTQEALARKSCVPNQVICAFERGRMAPWPRFRKALAEALGVPESDLFPGDGDGKSTNN